MTKSSTDGHIETSSPHWIEWVTGSVSVLLVCALLGWIGWDMYRYDDAQPEFDISILSIEPADGNFRVNFDIRNTTQSTAAAVHVIGTLQKEGSESETADVTLDYVASESHDNGTLFFTTDPASGNLQLRVVGFTEP